MAVGVNFFLLALGSIRLRDYRRFRPRHTLGLFVSSAPLLAENSWALYYWLLNSTLSVWFSTAVPAIAR